MADGVESGGASRARGRLLPRLLPALLIAVISFPVAAEIYHYVDERGRKVYVNRESQIPYQYRDKVETRQEPGAMNSHQSVSAEDRQLDSLRRQVDSTLESVEAAIDELETPIKVIGNGVIVPVRAVYGARRADTQMLLDTGASGTVFHRDALKGLNGATYKAGQARVASGEVIDVHAINLDRIEIGPYKIKATRAMVIDPVGRSNHDGLLGMDFLRQVQYRIDFEHSLIVWEPERYDELKARRDTLLAQQKMEASELIESLTPESPQPD